MKNAIALTAGATCLALSGATAAMAEPTPDPLPDYTWECDTDSSGHTSCYAVGKPDCLVSPDGKWVLVYPPGTFEQQVATGRMTQLPSLCTGGPPWHREAPRLIDPRYGPDY